MKPDATAETELLAVLERFCSAFADRDAEAVIRLLIRGPDVIVCPRRLYDGGADVIAPSEDTRRSVRSLRGLAITPSIRGLKRATLGRARRLLSGICAEVGPR